MASREIFEMSNVYYTSVDVTAVKLEPLTKQRRYNTNKICRE